MIVTLYKILPRHQSRHHQSFHLVSLLRHHTLSLVPQTEGGSNCGGS